VKIKLVAFIERLLDVFTDLVSLSYGSGGDMVMAVDQVGDT
jgi:hypothetical protein